MSSNPKRRGSEALLDARALSEFFSGHVHEWRFAGSIRRGEMQVGDVDHVVIPKTGQGTTGLFGADHDEINLLWAALTSACDTMVRGATLSQAIRQTAAGPRTCWGEKHRAIKYNGFVHEIYTATPETIGIQMIIRTGPAEFSRNFVTRMKAVGYPVRDGRAWDGTGPGAKPIPTPTETDAFKLAGWNYVKPEHRR